MGRNKEDLKVMVMFFCSDGDDGDREGDTTIHFRKKSL